ncbi:hypothetical protein [Nocardia sp. NPDC051463]|uniref:hypothetical protein n=1 Tax=Nocardia sp. NPDC051463 TaxID=3154845 RepID=UPI0034451001
MLELQESIAMQPVQPILGGMRVEPELADLFDVVLGVEPDDQVERNTRPGILCLLVQQVFCRVAA